MKNKDCLQQSKIVNSSFWCSNLQAILNKLRVLQSAPTGPILKFLINFHRKSWFKCGKFFENNSQHKYFGPHIMWRFDKLGVCKLSLNGPNSNFLQFPAQNPNKIGFVLWKNCQLMYLGPHNLDRFCLIFCTFNDWKKFATDNGLLAQQIFNLLY